MNPAFNYGSEVLVLQLMHFPGDGLRRIVGIYRAGILEDDPAFVEVFVDQVNGNPRFFITSSFNGFVNTIAIHAFTAMTGKQRRMNVEDAVGESVDQRCWNQPKEAREYQVRYVFVTKPTKDIRSAKLFAGKNARRHIEFPRSLKDKCIRVVGEHHGYLDVRVMLKILHDGFRIGAVAGSQQGKSGRLSVHGFKIG